MVVYRRCSQDTANAKAQHGHTMLLRTVRNAEAIRESGGMLLWRILWLILRLFRPVTKKMDPPEIVPPGPNTSKYLDPPVQLLQSSAEVFGPPLK